MKQLTITTLLVCAMVSGCNDDNGNVSDVEKPTVPPQEFGKRDWKSHPPTTEFEELAFFYEGFQESRYRAVLKTDLNLYDNEGQLVASLKPGLIIHSSSMDDVGDTDLSDNNRNKILFDLPAGAEIEWLKDADQERLGEMWYRNEAAMPKRSENSEPGERGQ